MRHALAGMRNNSVKSQQPRGRGWCYLLSGGLSAQFLGGQLRQVVGIHGQARRLVALHVIIIIVIPARDREREGQWGHQDV